MANLVDVTPLPESSDSGPALAAVKGVVFLAWKGVGNNRINVGVVDGANVAKHPSQERSSHQPALVSSNGLYIAWKGDGNEQLNGAEVVLGVDSNGNTVVQGLKEKDVLPETSDAGPALGGDSHTLLLAWRGSGNDQLNVTEVNQALGASAGPPPPPNWEIFPQVLPDASDTSPAVTEHEEITFIAFKGAGNTALNLLASGLLGPPKSLPIEDPTVTVVLPEDSSHAPALAVHDDSVYIAWKGADNLLLNVARIGARIDGRSVTFTGLEKKKTFENAATDDAPALVSNGRTLLIAWKGAGNHTLNIATVPP